MVKYVSEKELAAGAASVAAFSCGGTVAMLNCGIGRGKEADAWENAFDRYGGNGDNNAGGNGGSGNGRGPNGSGPDGNGNNGPHAFIFGLARNLLAALLFAAAFPAKSFATSSSTTTHVGSPILGSMLLSRVSAPSPSFERTSADGCPVGESSGRRAAGRKVMHVSCKGGTLVVPLTGQQQATTTTGFGVFGKGRVVAAPISLTQQEQRMLSLCDTQYQVRENLRV